MDQICAKKGNPRNKKCGATFNLKLLEFLESPNARKPRVQRAEYSTYTQGTAFISRQGLWAQFCLNPSNRLYTYFA